MGSVLPQKALGVAVPFQQKQVTAVKNTNHTSARWPERTPTALRRWRANAAVQSSLAIGMPRTKGHLKRSGEHARGAARLHAERPDIPHAKSEAWHHDFAAREVSVEDLLGAYTGKRKEQPSVAEVGAMAHRTSHERAGSGWSGGKCARTLQRRAAALAEQIDKERTAHRRALEILAVVEQVLANREKLLKPEAGRLNYDPLHLNDKYVALRVFYFHRAHGSSKVREPPPRRHAARRLLSMRVCAHSYARPCTDLGERGSGLDCSRARQHHSPMGCRL